tara:strand:+ start:639 stop:989 length:351 start_codon:yes stop_codon:yes gene_type:complete
MYRKKPAILALACAGLLSYALVPEATADSKPLPEPISPPDFVEHDEEMEPEVTIIQREDATVEEYRVNGRLYMVKITPFIGKPYYFIDHDGNGLMRSRMSDIYNPTRVPQWVIFSW